MTTDGSLINAIVYAHIDPEEGDSKIRFPQQVTTGVVSRGNDGWTALKNVRMTPHEINATAALGLIGRPKVRINREAGSISVIGTGRFAFSGDCTRYEPSAIRQQF
jgi:hypothetical protein